MAVPASSRISIGEYLQRERAANYKSEYYHGEMFAMAGAGIAHNRISTKLLVRIGSFLEGKNCEVFGSDLRVHVKKNTLFTYPDVTIVCGQPDVVDKIKDTVINPSVIIEILSAETKNYDRGEKFELYRDITSLKEYLLINSEKIGVEVHRKQRNGSWLLSEFKSLNDSFEIQTIKFRMKLADLYKEIGFG